MMTPTGKTRHRIMTRLFRRPMLVLQYEWHISSGPRPDEDGEMLPAFERFEWRDADCVL